MRKFLVTGLLLLCQGVVMGQISLSEKIASLSGSYRHSPPCADCTGIATTLTLDCEGPCNTGTYTMRDDGVNTINGDKSNTVSGKWIISDTASSANDTTVIIALENTKAQGKFNHFFMLIKGSLELLDQDKQPIDPPFNLILLKLDSREILDLR